MADRQPTGGYPKIANVIGPDIGSGPRHRAFLERLRRVALATRRPIMFGVLATKQGDDPTSWAYQTKYIDDTVAAGGRMFGQGTTRSINAIFSLKSYLPFDVLPAWRPIRALPGILRRVASRLNTRVATYPPLTPAERAHLLPEFADANEQLGTFLDRDLRAWNEP